MDVERRYDQFVITLNLGLIQARPDRGPCYFIKASRFFR